MWLSWQWAVVLGAALAVASFAARRRLATGNLLGDFFTQAALIAGLYALWQFIASYADRRVGGAVQHGLRVWGLERDLHLPSEASVQRLILPHPLAGRGQQRLLRRGARAGARHPAGLAVRAPPGPIRPVPGHSGGAHLDVPARLHPPRGAAPAPAPPRPGRYRLAVPPVRLRAPGHGHRRPAVGDAVCPHGLVPLHRLHRHPGQHQPLPLVRGGPSGSDDAGRRGDRQSLLAGRGGGGRAAGDRYPGGGGYRPGPRPGSWLASATARPSRSRPR